MPCPGRNASPGLRRSNLRFTIQFAPGDCRHIPLKVLCDMIARVSGKVGACMAGRRSASLRPLDREEGVVSLARFKPCGGVLFFAEVKAPDARLNKMTSHPRHDL